MFFKMVVPTPVLEPLLNKDANLKTWKFIKNTGWYYECLRIAFLKNTYESMNHMGNCFCDF